MRSFTAVALFFLAACGAHPTPTASPPPAEPHGPGPRADGSVDACKTVAARTQTILTSLQSKNALVHLDPEDPVSPAFGRCFPAGKGSWAIAVNEALHAEAGDARSHRAFVGVRWSIAFMAPGGAKFEVEPQISPTAKTPLWKRSPAEPTNYYFHSDDYRSELRAPVVFDYDGDGVGELLVTSGESWVREGEPNIVGFVWTMRNGSIVPYPPAAGVRIVAFEDVDDDGRPDLIIERAEHIEPCGAYRQRAIGVRFALHSLPDGTFTPSDTQAIAFARKRCPRGLSGGVIHASGGNLNVAETGRRVACARLWGRSISDIEDELARRCTTRVPDSEACERPKYGAGECPAWLSRWARAEFPVSLR